VLIAAIPLAVERLCRLLPDHRTVCPTTLAEAQVALARERFALAIMGVHFDESRMFDLLSYARASADTRHADGLPRAAAAGTDFAAA
jgi:hypothetical protein